MIKQKESLSPHRFHIPVMGLGFTIDTPLKVAHLGISSAISVMEDNLVEKMRCHYAGAYGMPYEEIPSGSEDARAERIRAYTELLHQLSEKKYRAGMDGLNGSSDFELAYLALLPQDSMLHAIHQAFRKNPEDAVLREKLKSLMCKGRIEVNIMTRIDKPAFDKKGQALPPEFSDAKSALRGVAKADAPVSVVFSAGFNPGLYAYCEQFSDFFPDAQGKLKKEIILKVSDFRSARIQGLFLAKKGIWISEFRIESGLNCGGHAFVSDGTLMGPALEEFRDKRTQLREELFRSCCEALERKGVMSFPAMPGLRISAQGGIGNAEENALLTAHYGMDSCGWGSPFLLVPEVTSVDRHTLKQLSTAEQEDYYLSYASPLGIPFNNFRKSTAEEQRKKRIADGRPGSPCYRKFLSFNTEFTKSPICTASRQYQHKKTAEIRATVSDPEQAGRMISAIQEKDCLCEGLSVSALQKNDIPNDNKLKAVTICPGPNLAYFSGIFTLSDMCAHIYGRKNIRNRLERPHMFINELKLNIRYLRTAAERQQGMPEPAPDTEKYRKNLLTGIAYYRGVFEDIRSYMHSCRDAFIAQLAQLEKELHSMSNTNVCH